MDNKFKLTKSLVFIYILVSLLDLFSKKSFFFISNLYLLMLIGLFLFANEAYRLRINKATYLITTMLFIFYALNNVMLGGINPQRLVALLAQTGFGIALLHVRLKEWPKYFVYFLFIAVFTHVVLLGKNPNFFFAIGISQNGISVLGISFFTIYYINFLKEKRTNLNQVLLLAVITFFIAVMAKGRGGIISSALLLIGGILNYLKSANARRKIILTALIFPISLFIVFLTYQEIFAHTKFSEQGFDASTREMRAEFYVEEILNDKSLLIYGIPKKLADDYILVSHLHNSFLTIHSEMGVGVLILVLLILLALWKFFKKNQTLLLFCLLAIFIRSITDDVLLNISWFFYSIFISLIALSFKISQNEKTIVPNRLR